MIRSYLITAVAALSVNAYAGRSDTPSSLQAYAAGLGFKRTVEPFKAIYWASLRNDVDARKLVRIAIIESGVDVRAQRLNKNGTRDYGMFQINTVAKARWCPKARIFNTFENADCAAKIISHFKKKKSADPYWIGYYHSGTPSRKINYVNKLRLLEHRGIRK